MISMKRLYIVLAALLLAGASIVQSAEAAPPSASVTIMVTTTSVVTLSIACATPDPDGNLSHCDIPLNAPIGSTLLTATTAELPTGTVTLTLSGDPTGTFALSGGKVVTTKALVAGTAYSLILQATGT
jgi:hypothetical protein